MLSLGNIHYTITEIRIIKFVGILIQSITFCNAKLYIIIRYYTILLLFIIEFKMGVCSFYHSRFHLFLFFFIVAGGGGRCSLAYTTPAVILRRFIISLL